MATTFTKIASVTVGSGGASSIDFTSIPSTYTDLCLKISGRSTGTDDQIWIAFNSSTTGFSNRVLYGSGSSAASTFVDRFVAYQTPGTGTTANSFGNSEIYIPNYAGSSNKSNSGDTVWEQNAALPCFCALNASLWSNSAAITSISLTASSTSFAQYSTATLYGIKNS
jgi:hypothetical protein